jgi:uncharacterized protein (TIGR00255 family)
MLTSMTGFGRAEAELAPGARAVVEIRSVNHRYLEVECRLPEGLAGLEDSFRQEAARSLRRGRVRISVALKGDPANPKILFRSEVARRYAAELKKLAGSLKIPGEITLPTLLSLPGVMATPEKSFLPPSWAGRLEKVLREALAELAAMRRKEGQRLQQAIGRVVAQMERSAAWIQDQLPGMEERLAKRFSSRILKLAPKADPREMAAQAAGMVSAGDVSEELTRIGSHLAAVRQAVEGKTGLAGRTLDFLAQELHREVNTLGSKAFDAAVVRRVVEMKHQIEKLREQAANVE